MNSYIGISSPLLSLLFYIKVTSIFSSKNEFPICMEKVHHHHHPKYLCYVICEQRFNYLKVFKKIHHMAQKYIKKLDLKFFST